MRLAPNYIGFDPKYGCRPQKEISSLETRLARMRSTTGFHAGVRWPSGVVRSDILVTGSTPQLITQTWKVSAADVQWTDALYRREVLGLRALTATFRLAVSFAQVQKRQD